MKRLFQRALPLALAGSIVASVTLSGCGNGAQKADSEKETAPKFEYFARNPEPRTYIQPAAAFAGGDGTSADPYQISNAAELAYLSQQCNLEDTKEAEPFCKACYVLTGDIVINERSDGDDWTKTPPQYAWRTIANGSYGHSFEGTFDGGNHTVSGLFLNEERDPNDKNDPNRAFGLFGDNKGTIKNLKLEKSLIWVSGNAENAGGIAGVNNKSEGYFEGVIENCVCDAELISYETDIGGIAGDNKGKISGCEFKGSVRILKDDQTFSQIGGIAGVNSGEINGCVNSGSEISVTGGSAHAGGITGKHSEGTVSDCSNSASVSGSRTSGGIAGIVFVSNIGGDFMSKGAVVKDCVNTGAVSGGSEGAGGIVGSVTLDHSKYNITVSNCKNSGVVSNSEQLAGIASNVNITCNKTGEGGIDITGCVNTADISGYSVGGIISALFANSGKLTLSSCINEGLISGEMYTGGICGRTQLDCNSSEIPLDIRFSDLVNKAKVSTDYVGGGILGAMVTPGGKVNKDATSFSFSGCSNTAELYGTNSNAYLGGITGNIDLPGCPVNVSKCTFSGGIEFKNVPPAEDPTGTDEKDLISFELSRIAGGIVGRIGTGMFLTTSNEAKNASTVNDPNARIVIDGCDCAITVVAPDENMYLDEDNKPIYQNLFGGIVGDCSGEEGFEFLVKDSKYSGTERGLGNKDLPDVGTKK